MQQYATSGRVVRGAMLEGLRAIERLFDRAFGPRDNPWRHLGALSFFFFWIVAVSGVYVYVFFDTSVAGAYLSVERLTAGQWYAGGVMRSLHRYASDALVVTVVLHLAKEWLHGRHAGFHWFSWVSGVPLLWLAAASGIGGYWLAWDGLAQFVAIATSEWFDRLPLFGEPLMRNFLTAEAVSDRLFTLLIFLHIGVPLALLAGMFVHIQRVNHADTQPARALAWGTLAALLALSLAKPAVSHAPADLALVPQPLALDWFYLALYPLLYQWSAGGVWAIAGAATLLLSLLPFVARAAKAPVARVDLANCNGCARCFADCPYAAIVMRPRADGRPGHRRAVVIPGLCAACGICAGACPSSTPFRSNERLVTGIDMPQLPVNALRARLERRLRELRADRRVIVFGCDHGAAVGGLESPGIAAFSLLCVGQLAPAFVEYALRSGADGVLVTGCRGSDCAFRLGNLWTGERLARRREPHLRANVAPRRLRLAWAGAGEEGALARELDEFCASLAALPRNEAKRSARWRRRRALSMIGMPDA